MFNASRLVVARHRKGMTKKELAQRIGVEPRAITGFEAGEYEPSPENLTRISLVLGFSKAFFQGDDVDIPLTEGVSFRAMTKMTARQRDTAISAGALAYLVSDWVEDRFDLPAVDIPDLRDCTPQAAAAVLRQHWRLGERPIKNMVHLLENFGIRVFSLDEKCKELDAYSVWRDTRPCVFLNTQKSAERSRFDAAHELGHLVLHKHAAPNGIEAEKEADEFAGAFLMPEAALRAVERVSTIDQIIALKSSWKVSVAAMTFRLHQIGVLSSWHYQTIFREMSVRGWRTNEPFGGKLETSQVWKKVFSQLRADGGGVERMARDLQIPSDEIVRLVFGLVTVGLPSGSEGSDGTKSKAHLRVVK